MHNMPRSNMVDAATAATVPNVGRADDMPEITPLNIAATPAMSGDGSSWMAVDGVSETS